MAGNLKICISGSTGLIGSAASEYLRGRGHQIIRLVRKKSAAGASEIYWDPSKGEIDAESLEGMDAIIHLAGKNVAQTRWNKQVKGEIYASRIDGTRLISETIAGLKSKPAVLISASATGFYGNRGDEKLTEASTVGTGFFPDTCRDWENTAQPARAAGVRVVNTRFGIVLSNSGGVLKRMLPPFRFGLGARLGSGTQYMSWISIRDLLPALDHVINTETLSGPVNFTAPEPVTNAEFTRTLARILKRPAPGFIPEFAIELLFGEMGRSLLLDGVRVLPSVLDKSGFRFDYPELENALRQELEP